MKKTLSLLLLSSAFCSLHFSIPAFAAENEADAPLQTAAVLAPSAHEGERERNCIYSREEFDRLMQEARSTHKQLKENFDEREKSELLPALERTIETGGVEINFPKSDFSPYIYSKKDLTLQQIEKEERHDLEAAKAISTQNFENAFYTLEERLSQWNQARALTNRVALFMPSPTTIRTSIDGDILYTDQELKTKEELTQRLEQVKTELISCIKKEREAKHLEEILKKTFRPAENYLRSCLKNIAVRIGRVTESNLSALAEKYSNSYYSLPKRNFVSLEQMETLLRDPQWDKEWGKQILTVEEREDLLKQIKEFTDQTFPLIERWNTLNPTPYETLHELGALAWSARSLQSQILECSRQYAEAKKTLDREAQESLDKYRLHFSSVASKLSSLLDQYQPSLEEKKGQP